MPTRAVAARLSLDVREAIANADRFGASVERNAARAERAGARVDRSSAQTGRAYAAVERGARNTFLAGAVGLGIMEKANYTFDKSMGTVNAATHANAQVMEEYRGAAVKAGADTVFSASEAAQGITELAKAGVGAKDILGGGLTGALNLASAGSLGVGEAAEYMATALTQFQLKGTKASHVADLLAAGAGKAQGEVSDMALALTYAGVPANQLGVSLEQTTGTIALLAKNGIIGEKAGTSLRGMLASLTSPSKVAAKEMESLGISVFDAKGNFIGFDGVAKVLHQRLGGLTQQERSYALGRIFGNEQLQAANVLYREGAKGVHTWTKNVDDSGYAADTAKRKLNNLAGDVEYLKGDIDSLFIKRGSGFQDGLRDGVQLVDKMVVGFSHLPEAVQSGVVKVTALTTATAGALYVATKLRKGYQAVEGLFGLTRGSSKVASAVVSKAGATPVIVTNWPPGLGGLTGGGKARAGIGAAEGVALGGAATRAGAIKLAVGSVAVTAGSVLLAGQVAQGISSILASALPRGPKEKSPLFSDFTQRTASGSFLTDTVKNRDSLKSSFSTVSKAQGGGGIDGYGLRSSVNLGKLATFGLWNAVGDDEKRVRKLDTALADLEKRKPGEAVKAYQKVLDDTGMSAKELNKVLPKTAEAMHPTANPFEGFTQSANIAGKVAGSYAKTLNSIPKDLRTYVTTPGQKISMDGMRNLQQVYKLNPKQLKTIMQLQGFSKTQQEIVLAGKRFSSLPKSVKTQLRADSVKSMADVRRLQRQYGLTPRQVATVMRVSGVDEAIAKAHRLRMEIAGIQSKSVTITEVIRGDKAKSPGPVQHPKADGGPIIGRGGPREDNLLTPTSNGEFVINAEAYRRNRALVEAINAHRPLRQVGYANGGPVGSAPASYATAPGVTVTFPAQATYATAMAAADSIAADAVKTADYMAKAATATGKYVASASEVRGVKLDDLHLSQQISQTTKSLAEHNDKTIKVKNKKGKGTHDKTIKGGGGLTLTGIDRTTAKAELADLKAQQKETRKQNAIQKAQADARKELADEIAQNAADAAEALKQARDDAVKAQQQARTDAQTAFAGSTDLFARGSSGAAVKASVDRETRDIAQYGQNVASLKNKGASAALLQMVDAKAQSGDFASANRLAKTLLDSPVLLGQLNASLGARDSAAAAVASFTTDPRFLASAAWNPTSLAPSVTQVAVMLQADPSTWTADITRRVTANVVAALNGSDS